MKKKMFLVGVILMMGTFVLGGCGRVKPVVEVNENYTAFVDFKYGSHERHLLDLTLPNKTGEVGLVLYIHGGGWTAGSKEGHMETLVSWSKRGFAAGAINYRYADGKNITYSNLLDDITASLVKIKAMALEKQIDINKVMFIGGSAGGHLSLLYAYSKTDIAPITPVAAVSFSGPTDLADPLFYPNNNMGKLAKDMIGKVSGIDLFGNDFSKYQTLLLQASPINYITENSVPSIICHGKNDELVPYSNAVALSEKLASFNVEHEFITFLNSGHGLENDVESWNLTNNLINEFADNYLK